MPTKVLPDFLTAGVTPDISGYDDAPDIIGYGDAPDICEYGDAPRLMSAAAPAAIIAPRFLTNFLLLLCVIIWVLMTDVVLK